MAHVAATLLPWAQPPHRRFALEEPTRPLVERVASGTLPSVKFQAVRDLYDQIAAPYAEAEQALTWARPVDLGLLFAFAKMATGMAHHHSSVVGDVGCGPGHVTKVLGQLGLRAIGIDYAPGMIEQARAHFPEGDLRLGSIERLEVGDGQWAGATALGTMWHCDVQERLAGLRELARVIRPGGVLLYGWLESASRHPAGSVFRLRRWFGVEAELDLHLLSIKTVAHEMAAAGFEVISATLREPLRGQELPMRRGFMLARRAPR
jgi:SAM-dependent methyltransferase